MGHRCLPVAAAVVMVAACSGGGRSGGGDPPRSSLPGQLVQESHDLVYGLAGTDSIIPWTTPGDTEMTLGILIANRSDERVRIEEFEVAEFAGVTVVPELVVLSPIANHQLGSEGRWPPTRRWDPAEEHPFGPFDLPPGDPEFGTGANVLMRVTFEATFGHVKGYWVRGTQGGDEFEDFVDTFTAICVGTDVPEDDCYDYANEHSFSPLGEPPDTVPTGTATTAAPP